MISSEPALDSQLSRRRRLPSPFAIVSAVLAALVLFLIVYPLGRTYIEMIFPGGSFSPAAFEAVASNASFWRAVANTLVIVGVSGVAAVMIGTFFAWINERTDGDMGIFSRALPLFPMLIPSVAVSIGWLVLADDRVGYVNIATRAILQLFGVELGAGPFNIATIWGLFFVYTLELVPYVFILVSAAFRNLDPSMEEAARIAGAGMRKVFWSISVRSVVPAIVGAVLLVVIVGLGMFTVPAIIGTMAEVDVLSTMTIQLIRGSFPPRLDQGVVISFFVMAVVMVAWIFQQRSLRHQKHAQIGGKVSVSSRVRLGRWRWVARSTIVLYAMCSAILPITALTVISIQPFWTPKIDLSTLTLDNYRAVFASVNTRDAITNSLTLGIAGATVGILLAAVLVNSAQGTNTLFGKLVDVTTKLPGALTNLVIGVAFLSALGPKPFGLHGTVLILFLAYLIIYMPQASIAAGAARNQLGSDLIEAGWISGAGRARTFMKISLPLMRPGLTAGWGLIFVATIGELTASSLLSGTSNPVIGFSILNLFERGAYGHLAALTSLITIISTVVTLSVLWLGRRREGKLRAGKIRDRRRSEAAPTS